MASIEAHLSHPALRRYTRSGYRTAAGYQSFLLSPIRTLARSRDRAPGTVSSRAASSPTRIGSAGRSKATREATEVSKATASARPCAGGPERGTLPRLRATERGRYRRPCPRHSITCCGRPPDLNDAVEQLFERSGACDSWRTASRSRHPQCAGPPRRPYVSRGGCARPEPASRYARSAAHRSAGACPAHVGGPDADAATAACADRLQATARRSSRDAGRESAARS